MNNKQFNDPIFFISKEGENMFNQDNNTKQVNRCQTDTTDEITLINEGVLNITKGRLIEIVVGMGNEIPLWHKNTELFWRFNAIFDNYNNSIEVKNYIRRILNSAINQWGTASPVKFTENNDIWDFEIIIQPDDCSSSGCVLASAFFPNDLQNLLIVRPKMFQQNENEQIETLIHELGHIFGLRHYFAKEKESKWRSEIFGNHHPLTIMNYGAYSKLTDQDKIDLKQFYEAVWNGTLKNINNLPIKLYHPYSY